MSLSFWGENLPLAEFCPALRAGHNRFRAGHNRFRAGQNRFRVGQGHIREIGRPGQCALGHIFPALGHIGAALGQDKGTFGESAGRGNVP